MTEISIILMSVIIVNVSALKAHQDNRTLVKDKLLALGKGTQFVLFYSPNCPYCEQLLPIWLQLEEDFKSGKIRVDKVDCSVYRGICKRYSINTYPTLIWLKDGNNSGTYSGEKTYEKLRTIIEHQSKRTWSDKGSTKEVEGKINTKSYDNKSDKTENTFSISSYGTTTVSSTTSGEMMCRLITRIFFMEEERYNTTNDITQVSYNTTSVITPLSYDTTCVITPLSSNTDNDITLDPMISRDQSSVTLEEGTTKAYKFFKINDKFTKLWKIIKPKKSDRSR